MLKEAANRSNMLFQHDVNWTKMSDRLDGA